MTIRSRFETIEDGIRLLDKANEDLARAADCIHAAALFMHIDAQAYLTVCDLYNKYWNRYSRRVLIAEKWILI